MRSRNVNPITVRLTIPEIRILFLNSREYLIPSQFQEKIVHFAINPSAELVCEFAKEYVQDESVIVIANVLQTKINDLSKVLTYSQRTYN